MSNDAWDDVHSCILEIEWYATRKKDLSETAETAGITWSDMLLNDLADLEQALAKIPGSPFVASTSAKAGVE